LPSGAIEEAGKKSLAININNSDGIYHKQSEVSEEPANSFNVKREKV
jgi:hypothetical protein